MVLAWRPRMTGVIIGGAAAATLLAGCSLPGVTSTGAPAQHVVAVTAPPPATPPKITITPADQAQNVPLDAPVQVTTDVGRLQSVSVQEAGSTTPPSGTTASNGASWQLNDGLDSGASYIITAVAVNGSHTVTSHASFTTLVAQSRLLTSYTPYDGSVVGVGEPIDLTFDTPIPDSQKAEVVDHIHVTSTPGVIGAWHWYTDSALHFRPEGYWPAGTHVTVNADLKGVNAGNGVWGLGSWSMSFTVGPKHLSVIDDSTHMMQVYQSDQLIATYPVSLGKPGFATLSGTLVVLYKSYVVKMQSCGTFGGAACVPGSANYYDENVYYDTAISTNGFFIHAAPWSVYAQGHYDVSHGCVNLSTDHAITFYNWSVPGDVVIVEHTTNPADYTNGEEDWQIPFSQLANTPGSTGSVYTGTITIPLGAAAAT